MQENRDFYTVSEAAKLLHVGITTLHRYIRDGTIRAYRVRSRSPWRIPKKDFDLMFNLSRKGG